MPIPFRACVLAFLLPFIAAASPAQDAASETDGALEVRRLLVDYRLARTSAERRTKVALALAANAALSELENQSAKVLALNAEYSRKLPPAVGDGITTLNHLRIMCGLVPLEIDPKLCQAAWGHSRDMQSLDFFSHKSPVEGKTTYADRAKQAGTTASGENIFAGSTSGKKSIEVWFYSPGHHKNMLGNHRRVGLGNAKVYWTLLLGK